MIPLCRPFIPKSALENVRECLASGWLGYGPACRALEERFTARGGWALATSSCTSALYLAGQLCRRDVDDEVIVPAITFVSTAMAFQSSGYRVRIADVDPESLLLLPEAVEDALSPRTVAVVAVHLYGQRCPLDRLRALCDRRGLVLVEDAAHRLDLLDPRPPVGDLVCYSFNAVKEAPGGEGGVLWGRDMSLEPRARSLSNLGLGIDTWERSSELRHHDYRFDAEVGLKLRLNDVSAGLVLASIDSLAQTRQARAEVYQELVQGIGERTPNLTPLRWTGDDSWLMCVLRARGDLREALRARLAELGVASSVHYPSLSRHPLFAVAGLRCRNAETADREILTLPCYPTLSPDERSTILSAVRDATALVVAAQ